MPRLPTADDLGALPSLESRRGIATIDASPLARGAQALGTGVTRLGDAIADIGLARQRKEDAEAEQFARAKADSTFIPAHTRLLSEQKDGPDADVYARESQARLQEAASHIPEGRARDLWIMSKAGALATGAATVKGYADKAAGDVEVAGIQRSENDGLETIVRGSPEDAAAMNRAIASRYDEAARKGYITEVQAEAYKKAYAKRGIHARIGGLEPDEQIAAYRGPATDRDGTIDRIIGIESSGDPTARNPNSTATGLGQFTEGTWLATVGKHRPDLLKGRSEAAVLALRNDPALSREMVGFLLDDNNRALASAGVPVDPTTSYLAHFLGSGGATAVLKAKPGTPVSDVLGEDQIAANRSILAGKTVDSVIRWADRKMGGGSEARLAGLLPADQREAGLRRAEALLATEQRRAQVAQREEAQTLSARIADDLASVERTGQGIEGLRSEDVARVLGPQAAQDFVANRGRSRMVYEALDGIGSLPEADALRRLQQLQPKSGTDGYRADAEAYGRAAKQVDAMLSLRHTDPARAVEGLPAVAQARAAAQYRQGADGRRAILPDSAQAIVRACVAAQDALGVADPLAVTKAEAQEIGRQLRAIGDDDPAKLQGFVKQLRTTYGPMAERVLADTLHHQGLNRDLADEATRALAKIGAGRVPNPFDTRSLDAAAGRQKLDDAMAGRGPSPAPSPDGQFGQPPAPAGAPPGKAARAAEEPPEAKRALATADVVNLYQHRDDPAVTAQFDAVYGAGMAKRALAEADRRLGAGGSR